MPIILSEVLIGLQTQAWPRNMIFFVDPWQVPPPHAHSGYSLACQRFRIPVSFYDHVRKPGSSNASLLVHLLAMSIAPAAAAGRQLTRSRSFNETQTCILSIAARRTLHTANISQ